MKRYKDKRRSCGLCKPHKRGWEDARTMQERRADEASPTRPDGEMNLR